MSSAEILKVADPGDAMFGPEDRCSTVYHKGEKRNDFFLHLKNPGDNGGKAGVVATPACVLDRESGGSKLAGAATCQEKLSTKDQSTSAAMRNCPRRIRNLTVGSTGLPETWNRAK